MSAKYKSDAVEAIQQSARALEKVGAIDKKTMRNFNDSCLVVYFETEMKNRFLGNNMSA